MARQLYDVIEIDGEGQEIVARQVVRSTPPDAANSKALANGRLAVRERVEQRAAFDPETEVLEALPPVIEEARVVYAWAPRPLTADELQRAVRAERAEANRARLGARADNTREDTIGDVLDIILDFIEANPSLTIPGSMTALLAERAAIKQEFPKPAALLSTGRN